MPKFKFKMCYIENLNRILYEFYDQLLNRILYEFYDPLSNKDVNAVSVSIYFKTFYSSMSLLNETDKIMTVSERSGYSEI